MSNRVNRRSFLRQTASAAVAASVLRGDHALLSEARLKAGGNWRYYGGDAGTMRYSPLSQINRSNVHKLKVAWRYTSGDRVEKSRTTIECTPLVIDGVMYLTTPLLKVAALDATSAKPKWIFNPFDASHEDRPRGVNRGIAYWENNQDMRVFFVAETRLIALDARTGKPV